MLDMSWGEVMVIGAVALIVIGPKDLPKALRTLGQITSKLRRMAAEFQGQFSEAMREAELDDVKRQIQGVNESVGSLNQTFNPLQTVRDELKGAIETPASTSAKESSDKIGTDLPDDETSLPPRTERAITLNVPPLPPVGDPAEAVAAVAERTPPAEQPGPVHHPAPEPARAEPTSEKA